MGDIIRDAYLETMNPAEKQRHADQGRQLLKQRKFPDDLIMGIREPRLRKEITKMIFSDNQKVDFRNLSDEEKKYRQARLRVRNQFTEYTSAMVMYKNAAYLALITGIIMAGTSITGMNGNWPFGVLSLIAGAALISTAGKRHVIATQGWIIAAAYSLSVVLEFVIFRMPDPLIAPKTSWGENFFRGRQGAVVLMFILAVPYLYIAIKIFIAGVLFYIYYKTGKYQQAKDTFESLSPKG